MFELTTLIIILLTFLIAGMVKGITGLGLPTVSLALLTVALDIPTAMALLLVPSFVTNIWQAFVGGNTAVILRRCWPFLVPATLFVGLGSLALTRIDMSLLSALLGALLVTYSAMSLFGMELRVTPRHERWIGPLLGVVNGILTGMTGSFVLPGVMFLQAMGLSRDQLIQSMGMLFFLSTLALAVALQGSALLTAEHGLISLMALIPAIGGMVAGQHIRKQFSEPLFRKIFFSALFILGSYISIYALF